MTLKISSIFILFLLFTNSASFSQTAVKSGAIHECATWNATGNFFLGATANGGGHTITATESNRTITSMALGSGSSVLALQGSNTVDLNMTGSFLTCPAPASEGPVYSAPYVPSGGSSGCTYGTVSSEHGCDFRVFYTNTTWRVTHSAFYKMYTAVKIYDVNNDCCWLSDFDLRLVVQARNLMAGLTTTRELYSGTQGLSMNSAGRSSCLGFEVHTTTVSISGNIVYLYEGELVDVNVSVRNCKNGWTSASMPIEIQSTYYFDHY